MKRGGRERSRRRRGLRPAARVWVGIVLLLPLVLAPPAPLTRAEDYGPSAALSGILSATSAAHARNQIVILTLPLPGNESDAGEMAKFGLLYGFSPRTIFVYRDEPTTFNFWNLQSNEPHDVMITDRSGQVLLHQELPQLKKTQLTLTFHQQGLFTFYCTMHQPYMSGQIVVLAPPGEQPAAAPALHASH
ncbi:MAG TPA: cupredoxin domain-containing protein [Candidatus Binataceae bacterium]|nr:cupredoxin domain-containing protein [Candidatus Binataceae bacterium]